jgi:hypothetical protein
MKKGFVFLILFNLYFVAHATDIRTVATSPGQLATDASTYLASVTDLTITGSIDARDFVSIKSSISLLTKLDLSNVTITANTLPSYCFSGLTGLTTVTLPSSLVSIGNNAFQTCTGLTGLLVIPNTVTSIGNYAFNNCSELNGLLTTSTLITYVGIWAFDGCTGLTGSLTIPNTVITIGDWAFYNDSNLTGSLAVPSSVTSIGTGAFGVFGSTVTIMTCFLFLWMFKKRNPLKKITSSVLLLFVTITCCAQTSVQPSGSGTSSDPYQISSLSNLYWLSQTQSAWSAGTYFVQTANIDASATSSWDSNKGFSPIGTSSSASFMGNYNGQEHTISGLSISRKSDNTIYVGLFGYINGATISNLGMRNVNSSAKDYIGGIVGNSTGGSNMSQCFVTGTLSGTDYVGGLIGYCDNTTVSACYVNATLNQITVGAGGLIGYSYTGTTISECYFAGVISVVSNYQGFIGQAGNTTINGSYVDLTTTSSQTGPAIGNDLGGNTLTSIALLSKAELQNSSSFSGWTFTSSTGEGNGTWAINSTINDGYPVLAWEFTLPAISTVSAAPSVTKALAICNITDPGYPTISDYGFCWTTGNSMPDISSSIKSLGATSSTGQSSATITGLLPSTTYTIRAYATNSKGTVYGNPVTFATSPLPYVTSVDVPSNGTYGIGKKLNFTVNFNDAVYVTGNPYFEIALSTGTVYATYLSGSGTTALVFQYTVATGNQDMDGVSLGSAAVLNNADVIADADGNNAVLTLNNIASTANIFVDGVAPIITITTSTSTSSFVYGTSFPITITASKSVTDVSGNAVSVSDFTLSNCIISNFKSLSTNVYTADITPKNAGLLSIVLQAGLCVDEAGNTNAKVELDETVDKRILIIPATAQDKTYDGSTTAAVTLSDDRLSGDLLTVSYTSAVFADKNASAGKTVTVSGISISGTDAVNYTLTSTTVTTLADITKRAITITADAKPKTYGDADPVLTAQITAGTIQGTDVASGSLTRVSGENVGSYAITQGSYTYGSNYAETYVSASFTITKRAITIAADAKSKTYGDSDPSFTAQVTAGTIQGTDVSSGSLTRSLGENVGSYAITQSTYTYGTNYAEIYVPANLTITKRAITITADAKSKTYGDSDPAFTAQVTSGAIHGTDVASGSLSRASDETVGNYAINQGSYTYGSNYTETYVSSNLTITKRAITITADAKSKTYGGSDPALTAQVTVGTIQGTDVASGSFTRLSGENVGSYAINQGSYTYGSNYTETYVSSNLTITKRAITITANAKSKTYGDSDPVFTAQVTAGTIQGTDIASGSLSRASGETVGTYTINQGSYTYGSNYTETYVSSNLTIIKRAITITANAKNKTYGDSDPVLTAQVTVGAIQGTDVASGSLTRSLGENVGSYAITQSTYTYGTNYAETFVSANLTITKRAIAITADAKSKTYGDSDPALTAQVTAGTIQGTDVASGSLSRASGENVGTYAITQGSYTYGNNYAETYVSANLTITKRAITITADAKGKTYGDSDPTLIAQVTSGAIQGADVASGSLTRVLGENVGAYVINKNTYTYGSNYDETYVSANLTITKHTITITVDAKSKTYGDSNPALTAQVTAGTIQGTDIASGSLARALGENVGAYAINKNTYTYGSNYDETYVSANLTITKRAITITADAKSKTYGDADPALTAQVTAGTIQGTDVASGSLTRSLGENVGSYAITQSTYTYGTNYAETYVPANLTITKCAITITADAKSKTYGDSDPVFTAQVTSGAIQGTDVASGSLSRASGETVGTYAINQGSYTYGSNYTETYVSSYLTITKRAITVTANGKSKTYGDSDPALTAQVTVGTIQGTDLASGSLTRVSGENVGSYTINQGSYSYGSNYVETYVSANLTIAKRAITISADAKSKTYGDVDPTFTVQATVGAIQGTDVASGSLTRVSGENVGTYAINQGTYTYGSNYDESYVLANLTITKIVNLITFAAIATKTYGDAAFTLSATASSGLTVTYTSDNAAVATVSGSTVTVIGAGTAHITASQSGNNIYAFATDVAQTLIVNKRNITISADAKYKTYGDVDPGFTAQVISGSIQGTDLATGTLVRTAGENVGAYTINQGTYTYGSNYAETFVSGILTITQRAITITADAKSKTYGDADPAFTVQITSGSIPGTDVASGSLTRASGENTGSYTINQGSYSYGPNYVETYVPANLTIGQRSITITADAKSKTYGDTDPVLTAQVTVGTIQGTDAASGSLTRVSGENVGAYAINKNTYTYGSNYNETFVPENLTITQRAITITADTESKTYGDADPALTAKVTAGTIQGTDVVTGELMRQSGETVGVYTINQGTYTYGSNYAETFVPANFTINRRIITFTITNELSACENTNVEIDYTILKGTPILYKLTLDASANVQGIQNVAYTSLPSTSTDGIISFSIPKGVSYGVYTGTLQMQDRLGAESDSYPFQFTINMSSDYIISKYDDVVALDNSSNIFASYQWYKDGLIIDGATEQFYNDLSGLVGVYFAKVTTVDGKTYITCSKEFDIPLKKKSVRAYPSLLASNQVCTVQVDGFSESELQGASLSVYTAQGTCVYRVPKVETLNSLSLSVPQIYIGHITLKSGKDYAFKVIVAN